MDTCNPRTWKVQAGGSEVEDHPWLHMVFGMSLGYMSTCLKKKIMMLLLLLFIFYK